jgi:hypothetical protein
MTWATRRSPLPTEVATDKRLPKLDRAAYLAPLRAEFERTLEEVADAVDEAPAGRVIREREERARDALDRFHRAPMRKRS